MGQEHWEIYQDNIKEWRFRFMASNGKELMKSSEGYVNRLDCEHAIDVLELTVRDRIDLYSFKAVERKYV